MKVYVGQTRAPVLIERLTALGFGECTQPRELVRPKKKEIGPKRFPWFFDNGVFAAFKAGLAFDGAAYEAALSRLKEVEQPPDFLVTPDLVGGGVDSIALSLDWVGKVKLFGSAYLVVQEGMNYTDVAQVLGQFAGIFVGGATLEWKWATAKYWVQLAHFHSKPCHIGRVGTGIRVKMALASGCDSIDSCVPLFSEGNLQNFIRPMGLVSIPPAKPNSEAKIGEQLCLLQ